MRNCAILLLLCVLHITRASAVNEELTVEIESDELMKTSDLEQAESKDASATEIIKQIRKLNPDGTFTIGFEADDGSFKIETRDLQGNVKQGTYGYIDENGEVKRVSYSTQNSTLFKEYQPTTSTKTITKDEDDENNETISPAPSVRYNRTFASTTRRPSSLAYLTSTHGPTTSKSNVVQAIPKRRISLSDRSTTTTQIVASSTDSSRQQQPIEGTTTVVYATSVPTPKPYLSRSTTSPNYSSLGGGNRKEKGVEIDQVERKVFIATSKDVTTMKPILTKHEKVEEKLDLIKRGNNLRRQLKVDDEAIEAQQQVLYGDGDESSAIYGSSFGNLRPLFTTTAQPKIPLQVLAARQHATQLQSILANSSPGTTTTTTTEKVYTKSPKRQNKVKAEEASEIVSENFITQAPGLEQITATEPSENDERRAFGRPLPPHLEGLYRPRNYLRQLQPQPPQNIPQQQQQQLQPISNNYPEQQPTEGFANAPFPFFPPQSRNPYSDYDRPLTVRDFERLLQILIYRQQQTLRINPFYPSTNPLAYPPFVPNYNQPNLAYQPNQIPRPPYFNPLSTGLYDPGFQNPYYSPSMPVSQHLNNDPMLQPQLNNAALISQQQQDPNQERFSRRRQYNSRFFSPAQQQQTQVPSPPILPFEQEINYNSLQGSVIDNNNFIPPSVREQLLYRMLILALRPDGGPQQSAAAQFPPPPPSPNFQPQQLTQSASSLHTVLEPEQQETSTIIKSTDNSSKKPVRSVQILGEEENE
ncbi:hypothetical protein PVAND_003923 [Polypedilum vanderplanki]|uniref:Uncharacterized protein n=1 Tax=Polypedilum vanderplanki TaxID=319348 RepID=A0A9J6BW27_POLVA|nr:hypothetical protein PVAND_003923 [Polypedilum vanderplanki]